MEEVVTRLFTQLSMGSEPENLLEVIIKLANNIGFD